MSYIELRKKKQKHGKISTTGLHLHTTRRLWRWSWSVCMAATLTPLPPSGLVCRCAEWQEFCALPSSFLPSFTSSTATVAIVVDSHHRPASLPQRECSFSPRYAVCHHIRDSVYCIQGHINVVFDVKEVCASCEHLQYGWTALAKGSIGTKRKPEESDDDESLANWKREQKMLEWIFHGLL